MISETDISKTIRGLAAARGWKPSYAARLATGSGDTLDRLDAGIGLTLRRASKIMDRLSDLWPADVPWPSDIPRPTTTREDAA